MNLDRYKNLLAECASQLSDIGDEKAELLFLRWLRLVNELSDVTHPNLRLRYQVGEVARSAKALGILATERSGLTKQARIESTVDNLLIEATRIMQALDKVAEVFADRGLPAVIGEYLSSVEFVMDYIQLRFCGPTLTIFAMPEIREGPLAYKSSDEGYRDAVCRRIGVIVRNIELHEGQEISISFSDQSSLLVSLRPEDRIGPEAATFSSASGGFWIW